jgi:hypothetical protein
VCRCSKTSKTLSTRHLRRPRSGLFMEKDLMVSRLSTREEQMKSLVKSLNTLTAYVIGVLIVWVVIFAIGYLRNGSTVGHPVLHVVGGLRLGMLSLYSATRVYPSKRNPDT